MNKLREIFYEEAIRVNEEFNAIMDTVSGYGFVIFSVLNILFYIFLLEKSKRLQSESLYFVKIIPLLTLSENSYVKAKLMNLLSIK